MTDEQRTIAEAAIDRRHGQRYEVICEEVSKITGVQLERVHEALAYMAREFIIKECAMPTHGMGTGPIPPDSDTWAWFKKGEMWPNE
jgi:hypothetical protein